MVLSIVGQRLATSGGAMAFAACIAALGFALPRVGAAQVLEIGDAGAVTVHDRPEITLAEGVAPISPLHRTTSVTPATATPGAVAEAASEVELSPELLEAVGWRESRLRQGVVSRQGAVGEMQLMPATAKALGVDPFDTRQNLGGGAAYLKALLHRYDGDLILALAAYNAGPGAVDHYGGVPPFKETREYVAAILDRLSRRAAAGSER